MKAISKFPSLLLFLLAVGATQLGAQEKLGNATTDPELISIFPLGGPQGRTVEAEIRGTSLAGVYAAWFDAPGLRAQIKKIEDIELQEKEAPGQSYKKKKTRHGQRVLLQVQIDPSTKCGPYSLRLCASRGISNGLQFLVNSRSIDSVSETSASHDTPVAAQPLNIPVIVNGAISEKGEVDYYSFPALKDQELTFKVISTIQVSGFDAAEITLYEPSGSWFDPQRLTRLAFHANPRIFRDAVGGLDGPPNDGLTYRFRKQGRYLLEVGTHLGIGGPDSFYQLLILPGKHSIPSSKETNPFTTTAWQERLFDRKLELNRLQVLWARAVTTRKTVPNQVITHGGSPISAADPRSAAKHDSVDLEPPDSALNHVKEIEPNETASQALEVTVPTLIEGTIERPGDVDNFRFKVGTGQQLAFEIETPDAKPFDFTPRLGVLDSNGEEILTNFFRRLENKFWARSLEPKTIYTFDRSGDYTLQIRDITARYGNWRFSYRVVIRPQIPHIGHIEVKEDRINLVPGKAKKLTVITEQEEGFSGQITLEMENLPAGVRFFPATEVEPEREIGFEGGEGKKDRFRAKSQKATIMLVASADAPSTPMLQLVRISARPIWEGELGEPLSVGEVPMMVVKPKLATPRK
ncbi:MAG: hypothetical protein FJW26_16825 [Acidimicrobiia bacterium]|nr:hypothetical protein [Acidimicrobiia bacterium]